MRAGPCLEQSLTDCDEEEGLYTERGGAIKGKGRGECTKQEGGDDGKRQEALDVLYPSCVFPLPHILSRSFLSINTPFFLPAC